MMFNRLSVGDPAPWLKLRTPSNPSFAFDTIAGRYIVLAFFGTARHVHAQATVLAVQSRPDIFNDDFASFFGVTNDGSDLAAGRLKESYPGYRYFVDADFRMTRAFGAAPTSEESRDVSMRWIVLDPLLRVMRIIPFRKDRPDVQELLEFLEGLPPAERFTGTDMHAPVIILPNVFETEFCRTLVELYDKHGGLESGFMREVNGKTVHVVDHNHKRRRDYNVEDAEIIAGAQFRIRRRVVPEIRKVHQFEVTRMERYIVACYAAEDRAHFGAHRDNTTSGTAHRRFAVSINLNDDFDGGEVSFPEFGPRSFRAPPGGAVVFSCSLLHKVSPVTRGRRYAFLPFLYDEAAARIREANNGALGEGVEAYRMTAG